MKRIFILITGLTLAVCTTSANVYAKISNTPAAQVNVQAVPVIVPDVKQVSQTQNPPLDNFEYQIGPENSLQIDVYYGKGEKISQLVRVSSRGIITFPLVGELNVAGLTVAGLQDKLTKLLAQDYLVNPQVTVYIQEYSTVSILGEVTMPGVYPIKGRLSILELVSLAQGFTKFASPNKVKVIHTRPDGRKEETHVRMSDIINSDNADKNDVDLHAGDMVIVPQN